MLRHRQMLSYPWEKQPRPVTTRTRTYAHHGTFSRLLVLLLTISTRAVCVHGNPTSTATDLSTSPSIPASESPSTVPSPALSGAPSKRVSTDAPQPTPRPSSQVPLMTFTERGITMTLNGVEPLGPDAVEWFKEQTKRYIEEYYNLFTENDRLQGRRDKNRELEMEGDLRSESDWNFRIDGSFDVDSRTLNDDYEHRERQMKELQSTVYDATVSLKVIEMAPPYMNTGRVRRKTQTQRWLENTNVAPTSTSAPRLQITYDQEMIYRNNTVGVDGNGVGRTIEVMGKETIANLIQEPFNTFTRRDTYINYLKDPTAPEEIIPIFERLETVGPPELQEEKEDKEGISTTVIIAASAGGGAVLILGVLLICWKRKRGKGGKKEGDLNVFDATSSRPSNGISNGGHLSGLSNDENSTLADPPAAAGVFNPDGSLKDYGHTPSIGTMDYDYINSNAAASIVSSAGGTLGSRTMQSTKFSGHSQMMGMGGMGMSGMIGANGQESSIFDPNDEQSFEQHLYSSRGQHKEEIIEVFAPAGKLGVVIDTPNSGAPVVYNIKDTCPIADKLRVGDKLIAVDNEDVRSMTAPKVSKLISLKSKNRTRKFTVMRAIS